MQKTSLSALLGVAFFLLFSASAWAAGGDGWRFLFNGEHLDGWEKKNGEAEYEVRNGTVVGISKMGTPNTFLCTKEHFGDFILELEVWGDAALNSGIQFRSNSLPDYESGRVHGYQAEIDPSQRSYSGGIYDEGRRGWLYPLSLNPEGQKAYRVGQWNQYRIEAIGPELRIWVNGVNTANVVDDMAASGFIALQVHSIGNEEQAGREIWWRNIRIKTDALEEERWPMAPHAPEVNYLVNTLSAREKAKGWRLLWDGKTADGWRSARSNSFPEAGWAMEDGVLSVVEAGGGEATNGGDIISKDKFSSFELKLEFRITKGANSGIKYFVDPELNKEGTGSSIGLEFQILDDENHPDAKMGVNGNRTLGSLYDLIPAENLSVPGGTKVFRGVGEWNQAHLIVRGNHIEHWLNGFKVVEYERNTPMYRALVAYSKYKDWPHFGELPSGHILLQDHGNRVSFRSIKIRVL